MRKRFLKTAPCLLFAEEMMNAIRSMRARVTALFALFIALLMGAGGAAVQHPEERPAEKRSREIL